MTTFADIDVRPVLRAGGEPFGEIMSAINSLQPGEGLRLLATFKPVPLFSVLGSKGFTYEAKELDGGDWEVLFSPGGQPQTTGSVKSPGDDSEWPAPVRPRPSAGNRRSIQSFHPEGICRRRLAREN
jgi:uncharacterized protein (DUF2249 family)